MSFYYIIMVLRKDRNEETMNFKIENGQGILTIKASHLGDYLVYKRPLSLIWGDCAGSIGNYIVLLPYSQEYRDEFLTLYQEGIYKDYSHNIEGLEKLLSPLWKIFENGDYVLEYYTATQDWSFYRDTSIDLLNVKTKERYGGNVEGMKLIDKTTYGFYSYSEDCFIATQPTEKLNSKRIRYFKKEIKAGKRPFVLVYRNNYDPINDFISQNYLLDGHHKLMAYQELGIAPPIARVIKDSRKLWERYIYQPWVPEPFFWNYDTAEPTNWDYEMERPTFWNFDIEELRPHLYPWQIEHMEQHLEEESEW